MQVQELPGEVELSLDDDFSAEKIFECGQCFRWNREEDGAYIGVAMGKVTRIRQEKNKIFIAGTMEDFQKIWYNYFDLDRDYAAIRQKLCIDDYMRKAAEYGKGIRILNQDRWETLCSFIISQCNNIPRIKKIVEALCRTFGNKIFFEGDVYYTFPEAQVLAGKSIEDLAPLRCGYRAPYILDAARRVAEGSLNLEELACGDLESAREGLRSIRGVGEKVANCAILFSLRKLEAFPVDVWMKRAIAEHYGKDFDPQIFGSYAGIAQQYMFYYQREEA